MIGLALAYNSTGSTVLVLADKYRVVGEESARGG